MIVLCSVVALPPVVSLVLRSNGVLVFLSVCMGSVLATHAASDMANVVSGFTQASLLGTLQWTSLGLLFTPVVCTVLFSRKKLQGGKLLLGFVAAAAGGVLLATVMVPYLSTSLQNTLQSTTVWHEVQNLEIPSVLAGSVTTLLYLFITRWKPMSDKKKHHK